MSHFKKYWWVYFLLAVLIILSYHWFRKRKCEQNLAFTSASIPSGPGSGNLKIGKCSFLTGKPIL